MLYQVKEKFSRGSETLIASFNRLNDAKLFIEKKLMTDMTMRVVTHYLLYEGMDLLEEFAAGSESGASGGQSSTAAFRPSPLQTSPRPSGMPPSSFKEEENKDK